MHRVRVQRSRRRNFDLDFGLRTCTTCTVHVRSRYNVITLIVSHPLLRTLFHEAYTRCAPDPKNQMPQDIPAHLTFSTCRDVLPNIMSFDP